MAKREFLMLAHTFKPEKHGVGGYYVSEKLDGNRCFWDGGISRGIPKSEIPWANNEKDERYKTPPVATGLWTRYGNVYHAPDSWLDKLPRIPLDGELYSDMYRQEISSIIKKLEPDEDEWYKVGLQVFGMPCLGVIFADGVINNTNYKKVFMDIPEWVVAQGYDFDYVPGSSTPFISTFELMQKFLVSNIVCHAHYQQRLPFQQEEAVEMLDRMLEDVVSKGGEGLVLRKPESMWSPERSHELLKVKPFDDMEGTVIGYTTGRETSLGSKLLGMMGALILDIGEGKVLELSGFTDAERQLSGVGTCYENKDLGASTTVNARRWAELNPEQDCPCWIQATKFPRGTVVTFKYRGKSKDGIPQEARFWRERTLG